MHQERLLKRLRLWGREEAPAGDIGGYTESVLEDLDALCNTQQGSALIDSGLGMPDFTALFETLAPPELDRIARSLRQLLDHYEPRLNITTVQHRPRSEDVGVVRFVVEGNLQFRDQQVPLNIAALLGGDGRWRLQQA